MSPVLWHVVRAYRLDDACSQDVVQAVWLSFVGAHDSIADERAVSSWLITTARRRAARTAAGLDRLPVPVEAETFDRASQQGSAEDLAVLDDEQRRLWEAVQQLDERCQRLLRVVAFQPRPDYAALSAELRMPLGSIGPTRGRCLKKARTVLEARGF